jgi:flagellum-specific ATP synthase
MISLDKYIEAIRTTPCICQDGKVTRVIGTIIEADGPRMPVGGICRIIPRNGVGPILSEVVGFRDKVLLLMPLCDCSGMEPGNRVVGMQYSGVVHVGEGVLGRVLDGMGKPMDGGPSIAASKIMPLYSAPLNPLDRSVIRDPLDVGIRTINSLITLGKGQRAAIMAGSGVGKSVLLGMMARFTKADVNVIGLIGERGREVKEFIEKDLGKEGLKRSVVVVATGDTSPLIRMRGAYVASAIAEFFRASGKDVLLMMDSITRFAMAAREVGLAAGEPPTSKAYPPSTFAHLPRLLERAGTNGTKGSITGLYTVLVEGDDMNEPIADAVRSIVDGHIVLERRLASRGHYPAIDVLNSVSRLMKDIVKKEQMELNYMLRSTLSDYTRIEDLVNLGAYERGNNRSGDFAVDMIDPINRFLRQDVHAKVTIEAGFQELANLFAKKKG